MFKPVALGIAIAAITSTFNVFAQERGPWPTVFPGGRFTPHELKYFEEQDRKRAAEKSTEQVTGSERGPWPVLFPGGRFTPHELKYFEAQERASKANPPTAARAVPFPVSVAD